MSHRFTFPVPTDHAPGGWHAAYMEVYEKLFAPMKETAYKVVEIGCDGGGGIRSYHDYFPKAHCVSVDISPVPESLNGFPRIRHLQMDAYTKEFVECFFNEDKDEGIDVIIDDGPHTLGSQEFFVQHYPKMLAPDGIAIVEDIQAWEHVAHLAALVPQGFFSMGIDLRANSGRYDDILLAIWRK